MTQWGLDNLFNPGKRHMDDEKQRLQSTREEVGDASGGRRIDLESGAVSISLRPRGAPADEPVDLEPALEAEAVPELALSAEADLEPEIAEADLGPGSVVAGAAEAPEASEAPEAPEASEASPAPEPPAEVVAPEPAAAAKRKLSAAAWGRRG